MSEASNPSRRTLLQGAGVVAMSGAALAACGAGSSGFGGGAGGGSDAVASGTVGKSSQVPIGGGTVFADAQVVVTQPTAGDFKGFSTRCTHQGCAVTSVTDGFIICPCHNSRFAVTDGAPTSDSLARQPLAPVQVKVSGGEITVT